MSHENARNNPNPAGSNAPVCRTCGAVAHPRGYATLSADGYCQVCLYEASLTSSHIEQLKDRAREQTELERREHEWFLAGVRLGLKLALRVPLAVIRQAMTHPETLHLWIRRWMHDAPDAQAVLPLLRSPGTPQGQPTTPPPPAPPAPVALDGSLDTGRDHPRNQREFIVTPVSARLEWRLHDALTRQTGVTWNAGRASVHQLGRDVLN